MESHSIYNSDTNTWDHHIDEGGFPGKRMNGVCYFCGAFIVAEDDGRVRIMRYKEKYQLPFDQRNLLEFLKRQFLLERDKPSSGPVWF